MGTDGNIYESVAIIAKRANQISVEIKQDLSKKLSEFASYNDSLDEVFENREQIEISRFYEKLPKPTLLATQEFLDGNIYWRDPSKKDDEFGQGRGGMIQRKQTIFLLLSMLVIALSFFFPILGVEGSRLDRRTCSSISVPWEAP